jgi:molybdate/tungstate transport system substrate-binding protein
MEYLLDPNGGLKVLKDMGQPPFVPARVPTKEMKALLPAKIQKLVTVSE